MKKSVLEISAPSIEIYLAPLSKIRFDKISKFGVPTEEDDPDEFDEFRDYVESHSVLSSLLIPENFSEIYATLDGQAVRLNPADFKHSNSTPSEYLAKPGAMYYLEINYGRQFLEFEISNVFDISKLTINPEILKLNSDFSFEVFSPLYDGKDYISSSGDGASYVEYFLIDEI